MKLSQIEEEVILLKAVWELIDSMVNFEMLTIEGRDPDSNITFRTMTHQKFFNIVLVDFLSCTDKQFKQTPYLRALKEISLKPQFDFDDSIASLRKLAHEFSDWLNEEIEVSNVWMPSINTETTLRLLRLDFVKMCGNISKHNFLRLISVAEELKEILFKSGVSVELEEALLALDDFYQWFHTDILSYHASTIAEFLNNIRWGIFEYLQPEFQRSIVWESHDPRKYRYTYPNGVTSRLAKEYYWELMNDMQSSPYVRRFHVTKYLKLRH